MYVCVCVCKYYIYVYMYIYMCIEAVVAAMRAEEFQPIASLQKHGSTLNPTPPTRPESGDTTPCKVTLVILKGLCCVIEAVVATMHAEAFQSVPSLQENGLNPQPALL